MSVYTIQQLFNVRELYREKPYAGFSLASICREKMPSVLVRGKDAYVARQAESELGQLRKSVQSALNKLTEENYGEIVATLQEESLLTDVAIEVFVQLVFQKAISEPSFSAMYAQLCYDMSKYEVNRASASLSPSYAGAAATSTPLSAGSGRSRFREAIVQQAQNEFDEEENALTPAGATEDERDEERQAFARRKRANIKFVGRLFLTRVLSERIMTKIISILLNMEQQDFSPPDINIEVCAELLETIGSRFESTADGVSRLDAVMERLRLLLQRQYVPRIHFKMMDLLDLRARSWHKRQVVPATPSEGGPRQTPAAFRGGKFGGRSPTVATPNGSRLAMRFPDSPSSNQSGSAASPGSRTSNNGPGWRHLPGAPRAGPGGSGSGPAGASSSGPVSDRPAMPPPAPPMPLEKRIQEMYQQWSADSGAIVAWTNKFVLYNQSEDELATAIVSRLGRKACESTAAEAQQEAARFFVEGLELSNPELVRGLAAALGKAVEDCIVEDVPKFYDRFVTLTQAAFGSGGDTPALLRAAVGVLFAAASKLVAVDPDDEPCEGLAAVWNKLPASAAPDAGLLTTIMHARGIDALQSELAARLTTDSVAAGRIPKDAVVEWAGTPQGAAAKDVCAALVEAGILQA